ncbi:hypothetical protein [Lutimonas vermicola]|uniref:SdiA-regulated family protein n=1 Tax=Lutimonas vermicola TaxID=414288 RepID=A0ABU9KXT2_9FLAO
MDIRKRTLFIISASLIAIFIAWKAYLNYSNKFVSVSPGLSEISGIEFDKEGNLWAINDSGNSTEIHQIDSLGNVNRSIKITNAKNIDWEDLTQDDFGHFFIGDFGNNNNERRDLTVYKIENPIDIKTAETEAEIIRFKFFDQDLKNTSDSIKNFDLEAFVFYKGRLYMFTKNRTKPFDGFTNLYRMEDYASNQKAKKVSRFKTCQAGKYQCWITSAALSPDRKKLALLGSNKIWIFKNWKEDDFFSGELKEIDLGLITQKEAITFLNDSLLVIADENYKGIGGNIYTYTID